MIIRGENHSMTPLTIVLAAAGTSSRFFPLNSVSHKSATCMLGQTLIVRTMRDLMTQGYTSFIIILSPKDMIAGGLQDIISAALPQAKLTFVCQEVAGGTGEALLAARSHITGTFGMVHPYYTHTGHLLKEMEIYKAAHKASGVILGSISENPSLEGIFKLEDHKILGIVEKPSQGAEPSNVAVRGVYIFDNDFLITLAQTATAEYSFEAACSTYAQKHNLLCFEKTFTHLPLKYPWHLFGFQKLLLSQLQTTLHPKAQIASTAVIDDSEGAVVIEEGAIVGHAAKISGPAYIGRDARVGDFSFVRQSSLEEKSVVGANSELVRSIMLPGSTFHYGYVADSIIGSESKIGAGLITANKRLDRASIKTDVKGKMIDSGLTALGIIVGSKANLGIGTRTMPGVMIGSQAVIYPGNIVKTNVPHGDTVGWK